MPQAGNKPGSLTADQVSTRIDPSELAFKSSAELQPFKGVLGQGRAENAIRFGIGMDRPVIIYMPWAKTAPVAHLTFANI